MPISASGIDLLGCEYLGGCPTIGPRVLDKVQLHLDHDGVTVVIAPQGLFTPAAARPVLSVAWSEITTISVTNAHARQTRHVPRRLAHHRVTLRAELAVIRTRYNTVRLNAGIGYVTPGRAHEALGDCSVRVSR